MEMTYEEKLSLYNEAKDAYYNGDELMSDAEFDALEKELGLENKSRVGTRVSTSAAYTNKHAFIMGSLDKVHVEKDASSGEINWEEVLKKVNMHLQKSGAKFAELSPKLDGCSFSAEFTRKPDGSLSMKVSQRGDGFFGPDILEHFRASGSLERDFPMIDAAVDGMCSKFPGYTMLVVRGEVLVNQQTYNRKWSGEFKNSRVFVSGNLNHKFASETKHIGMLKDLDFICYDYRLVNPETGEWIELDWMNPADSTYHIIKPYIGGIGKMIDASACHTVKITGNMSLDDLKREYEWFAHYRSSGSMYNLDGIVIKPEASVRKHDPERERPAESIAIKFIAEEMKSRIVDVSWRVGLTGECYPTAVVAPVYQDGKEITRASLHGYSYMVENKVGIGSEITMVMNGDIVPGVSKVISEGVMKMPDFETVVRMKGNGDVPHLYKAFSDEEISRHKFVCSAKALAIDGIKEKTAEKIWDLVSDAYEDMFQERLENLMDLMKSPQRQNLLRTLVGGKSTENIIMSMVSYKSKMTCADVIKGCMFDGCGEEISRACAKLLSGMTADLSGMSKSAYMWALNEESENCKKVRNYIDVLNIPYDKPAVEDSVPGTKTIKVIMTGSPADFGYKTKGEWLKKHPGYVETKKWTECQLLLTDDLDSTTDKMSKAKKLGIEIKNYF